MIKKCIHCSREFEALRATSLFCSASCRLKNHRLSVSPTSVGTSISVSNKVSVSEPQAQTVTVSVTKDKPREKFVFEAKKNTKEEVSVPRTFTPNWKLNGFKSKEEAITHAIGCLMRDGEKIKRAGLGDTPVIFLGGKAIDLV